MIEIIDKAQCSGCYACANICPKRCLDMKLDKEGFWYPEIDKDKCINCNLCVNVCPIIKHKDRDKFIDLNFEKEAYAAQNLNDKVREDSSSGGVFSLLAENIIKNSGVVIGATFNEEFKVYHEIIKNEREIDKLRRSKYVQSKIGDIYKIAKNHLENDKIVLFTGTPCQVAGLKKYLNKEYNNLITQDIICHGVPSPILWEKYKKFIINKNKGDIKNISFRSKTEGWRSFSLKFILSENKRLEKNIEEDLYLIAFQNNISLRQSCYECKFKGEKRESDITLADFWGIENTNLNIDDNKGTSLVIINTEKGKKKFDEISTDLNILKTDISSATKSNKNYYESANKNPNRNKFLMEIDEYNFEEKVREYCNYTYFIQAKKAIKKQCKRILNYVNLKK